MRTVRSTAVVAALLLLPSAAAAEPRRFTRLEGGAMWGAAAFEIAETAALILRMTYLTDTEGPSEGILLTAPFVVGAGAGVAGGLWCLPPRVALALHGGLYTGLAAGLATALIRGALTADGTLRFIRYEGIAALVGTVPGLLVGGLEADANDSLTYWFAGPPAGLLAGVVLAGILAVSMFLSGNDPGPGTGDQVIGWPIFAGLATGLVVATGSVVGE